MSRSTLTRKAAALAAALLGALAATVGGTGPASAATGHVLSGESVAWEIQSAGATALAPVASGTPETVGVALHLRDAAGEQAAAEAVTDPHSPLYRHFYTPAAWAARFALPASELSPTVRSLTASGLRVVYLAPTRDYLDLTGTAAEIDATFSTTLMTYRAKTGTVFSANATPPTVPANVDAVTGLSDIGAHTFNQTHCQSNVCVGTLQYTDLSSVYDLPSAYQGAGQSIAIIGYGDTGGPINDLRKFEKGNGLPLVRAECTAVAGDFCNSYSSSLTGGEIEWALDSEASTSMAPGIGLLHYYFSSTLADPAAFSAWANDPTGPMQANASFGACETLDAALGVETADDPIFTQIAAEGRTQFVSTGDTGGSCTVAAGNGIVNTLAPQVEWPAADRWVVAVGGTVLYTDGTGHRASLPTGPGENAWTHTGGGTSITQPEQSWQQQISVIAGQCTSNEDLTPRVPPVPCRGLPDVAAMSGDITEMAGGDGFADVEGGSDSGPGNDTADGGTSLSSPLWAGMWARIQSAKGDQGFAAPVLYALGNDPTKDASDFYDVTVGDNVQNPAVARGPVDPSGWDYVSGLGTPDVAHLIHDLAPGTPPPPIPPPTALPGSQPCSQPQAPESPLLWTCPFSALGGGSPTAIACPSATLCVVVDAGDIVTSLDPLAGTAATWNAVAVDNTFGNFQGVSCASTSLCVAYDTVGNLFISTDPTGGASTWSETRAAGQPLIIDAISCPSANLCVAVDDAGDVITSTNPGSGTTSVWTTTPTGNFVVFTGISCPSDTFCAAVNADNGAVITSTDPAGGPLAWKSTTIDGTTTPIDAVACASANLCVAADANFNLLASTNPGGGASEWTKKAIDSGNKITAISCPTASFCLAVDAAGNVLSSTEPTAASSWAVAAHDTHAPADSIACASAMLCAATDAAGNALIGLGPPSVDAPEAPYPALFAAIGVATLAMLGAVLRRRRRSTAGLSA